MTVLIEIYQTAKRLHTNQNHTLKPRLPHEAGTLNCCLGLTKFTVIIMITMMMLYQGKVMIRQGSFLRVTTANRLMQNEPCVMTVSWAPAVRLPPALSATHSYVPASLAYTRPIVSVVPLGFIVTRPDSDVTRSPDTRIRNERLDHGLPQANSVKLTTRIGLQVWCIDY